MKQSDHRQALDTFLYNWLHEKATKTVSFVKWRKGEESDLENWQTRRAIDKLVSQLQYIWQRAIIFRKPLLFTKISSFSINAYVRYILGNK